MQQHAFAISKLACGGVVVAVQCQEIAKAQLNTKISYDVKQLMTH
jgi:hypothetical protein